MTGKKRFAYPADFTANEEYNSRRGLFVKVERCVGSDERFGRMEELYEVSMDDGWVGYAWESELMDE